MTICDICGDEMSAKIGKETVDWKGISIDMSTDKKISKHPEYKKLIKTFGKAKFEVCFTCWMRSLGIPIKKR